MPTIRLQHPTPGAAARAAELCVMEEGAVLGLIRSDPKTKVYRFFPGKDNDIAFAFQHRDMSELIALVTSPIGSDELPAGSDRTHKEPVREGA